MDTAITIPHLWFSLVAALGLLALLGGHGLGRGPRWRARLGLVLSLLLMGFWGWLVQRPELAVQVIPAGWLYYLESTLATPFFMLGLGVVWGLSPHPQQHRIAAAGALVGAGLFVYAGLWMIQPPPHLDDAQASPTGLVLQSTDYSCVPAACATAINQLRLPGVPATEAEMAQLTTTRPAQGATLIRAMEGLNQRLAGTPVRARIIHPTVEQLRILKGPLLTPLRVLEVPGQSHMVVVMSIDERQVLLADPDRGRVTLPRAEFDARYLGHAISFCASYAG